MDSLDPDIVYGFCGSCLAKNFDGAVPIPQFHKELWEMCCSGNRKIAIAAPRSHAKSTSITLTWLLAALLFRDRSYAVIVSNTEGQAVQFLNDIKSELSDNESITSLFGNFTFIKDRETDTIIQAEDGYLFRIQAKGAEQKLRGLKWRNKRPDLFICDDFEEDECVMNKDRREKFSNWFSNALLPALSDRGKIIVVGTILHMDSLLENLMHSSTWLTKRYRAHNDDFSQILWPERFSKERLLEIRQDYLDRGNPAGYSQEYLNYPIDETTAYFRRDDFRYYEESDISNIPLSYYSAIDFAISEKERADYTVIATVAVDSENNLYIVDINRGRWDAREIIDQMFATHLRYRPELFIAEEGMIKKSIGPFLKERMLKDGVFINIQSEVPIKDKQTRARSLQARLRTGSVFFNRNSEWYVDLEQEMVRFPKDVHDDQVDALAWIGLVLDKIVPAPTIKEQEDEEWWEMYEDDYEPQGICQRTGY